MLLVPMSDAQENPSQGEWHAFLLHRPQAGLLDFSSPVGGWKDFAGRTVGSRPEKPPMKRARILDNRLRTLRQAISCGTRALAQIDFIFGIQPERLEVGFELIPAHSLSHGGFQRGCLYFSSYYTPPIARCCPRPGQAKYPGARRPARNAYL